MRHIVKKMALLSLLPVFGCAGGAHQTVVPGKTTATELAQSLGPPLAVGSSPLGVGAELRTYEECEFQLQEERVTGKFCKPADAQRSLQYWRQLWRNEITTWGPLPGQKSLHGVERFVLAAPGLKKSVIYDSTVEHVVEVVDYADATLKGPSDEK
jgi:hypothetical protein